jgi:signal transduction histidine kinase
MELDISLVVIAMKVSLRNKLSLTYILIALVCISLLSLLTNFFLDKQFREYVEQNQDQKNKSVVSSLSKQYDYSGGWNQNMVENIGVNALENGMIIKVKDGFGKIIWDATLHNNGMCQKIIEKMADNLNSHYHYVKGSYVEKPYSIISGDKNQVGTVLVGYYGPFYLSDNDLAFISTLNKVLVGVGIFSLILSFLLGSIMARRISTPISGAIKTARMISKGLYSDRVKVKTNTKEFYELSETVNNLAKTLETQEILRKRLTGDVAHELRTPLATLQSHLEAMIDGIWKPNEDRLKSCHEEVIRINKMVGDIDKLAKYESENLVLDKTNFDVSEVIRRLIHNFESEFNSKNVEIEFQESEAEIFADKDKFSQVMINLISNALKYTPSGGKVLLEIKEDSEDINILVKDSGTGISEEDLPLIFERFYRADKSRNRLTGGSGIGLTITKAIIEAHGGTIKIKSQLNAGTDVIVSIPKG